MSIPVSKIWVHFLSLVLKIPSPKQESVEAISIRPGLNDGFKGRRMVAEREEAGASSVHHLDRATIRQIENTFLRKCYRECTSKNTISKIHFIEYIIENTFQRIQYQICTTISRIPEYTSEDETHINNERDPRIQYQACTAISSNDSSDPRIHFTE